jgi:hypothetical protein
VRRGFEITGSGFSTHKTPSCSVVESHDRFVFAPNLGENTSLGSGSNVRLHTKTIGATPVRVRILYGNGHYSTEEAEPDFLAAVEISDDEWRDYEAYRAQAQRWRARLGELCDQQVAAVVKNIVEGRRD